MCEEQTQHQRVDEEVLSSAQRIDSDTTFNVAIYYYYHCKRGDIALVHRTEEQEVTLNNDGSQT